LKENLQLVSREKTMKEIHDEYEKQRHEREELERIHRTNGQSHMKMMMNLSSWFITDPYAMEMRMRKSLEIKTLFNQVIHSSISQSVEFPVGEGKDRITLSGKIENQNGIGISKFMLAYYKKLPSFNSMLWQLGLGDMNYVNMNWTHYFGTLLFGQFSAILGETFDEGLWGCIFTFGRHLTPYTTATLSWKEGYYSGLYLNVDRIKEKNYLSSSFRLTNSLGLGMKIRCGIQVSKKTHLKTGLELSLRNPGFLFGFERKLGKYTIISSVWHWNYIQGVSLNIK
jgi:hypothetical protein